MYPCKSVFYQCMFLYVSVHVSTSKRLYGCWPVVMCAQVHVYLLVSSGSMTTHVGFQFLGDAAPVPRSGSLCGCSSEWLYVCPVSVLGQMREFSLGCFPGSLRILMIPGSTSRGLGSRTVQHPLELLGFPPRNFQPLKWDSAPLGLTQVGGEQ